MKIFEGVFHCLMKSFSTWNNFQITVGMMRAPLEGSGPVLRCILSPLRLLSGAAWHLIQQEAVSHYGMLEEFVSLITGMLPDLLSYREMTQLTVGLRARLVLELCGMESPADPDTVQANLQRIETLVALHKDMELGDGLVKESGANFLALVQILITDPAERSIFFKDVYPLQYGVKFNTALQKLMWLFLSRLEKALPQPTLEEAAHMLSTAPSVMEECVQSLSQPQQIRNALTYQRRAKVEIKETSQLWSTSPDDCILSCLSSPRSVQILLGEQTALDTQSGLGLDYVPSYCQEVQVESVAITQYIQNEPETTISDEIGNIILYDAQESNECDPADTENSTAIDCDKVDCLDTDLDESPGKQDPAKVGVIDVKDGNGGEESLTPQETKAMVTNQKEATELVNLYMMKQPLVKLHSLDVSSAQLCKTFNSGPQKRGWPKKHLLNKTSCRNKQKERNIAVPCASITKPPGFQNTVSKIVPQLKKKHATVEGASGEYACSLCSFQDCEEIQLRQHLIVHHPEEYKPLCVTEEMQKPQDVVRAPCESEHQNSPVCKVRSYRGVPVCKTCPTCGKTFTRSSDMRRHQVSHTVDRPFLCPNCGKTFRYAFDLRRHQQRVCAHKDYVVVYKGKNYVSEDGCVEIKVNDSGTVCQHLHSSVKSSESTGSGIQPSSSLCVEELPESGAAHSTNSDSFLSCSQSEKKREDACMLINRKTCASSERCFKCVKCDALFNTVLDVQNHMHVHWGDGLLQCSSCGKYCPSPSELAKHTLLHEKESKHPCTLCSETLEGLDSLRVHYLNVHEFKGPYQCSKCDKTHPDLKVIAKHMKTHGELRPYQCSHCGKSFKQRSGLTVHAKIHSGDKPFLCEECGKCFSSNIGLQRHSVSHQSERPYTCPQCKHCFKTRYALHSHLLKHTTGASIPCEICGKLFHQASALHRHHRTHTGERPYSCPKCAKTFLTKEEVAKHMRYHTGERPFRCTLCSKTFTQTCYLSVHMRIHTGERPYQCSVCERAFVSSTHLKRHTLVHTRERPFKCDCGKAFNQAHTLKVHQRSQCLVQKKQL